VLACHPPPMPMDGLRLVWQGLHALLLQPMQGDNRSRLVQSSIKNDQARGGRGGRSWRGLSTLVSRDLSRAVLTDFSLSLRLISRLFPEADGPTRLAHQRQVAGVVNKAPNAPNDLSQETSWPEILSAVIVVEVSDRTLLVCPIAPTEHRGDLSQTWTETDERSNSHQRKTWHCRRTARFLLILLIA